MLLDLSQFPSLLNQNYLEQVLGQTPNMLGVYGVQCRDCKVSSGKKCLKSMAFGCQHFCVKVTKRYELKKIENIVWCWRKLPKTVKSVQCPGVKKIVSTVCL